MEGVILGTLEVRFLPPSTKEYGENEKI